MVLMQTQGESIFAPTGLAGATPEAQNESAVNGIIPTTQPAATLAGFVAGVFQRNSNHRMMSGVDAKLLRSLQMCRSKYTGEEEAKLAEIGVSKEMYTPITDTKRRSAMAQLNEIFNAPGDKPWTLSPTPVPDVPESVVREAFQEMIQDMVALSQQTGQIPDEQTIFKAAVDRVDEIYNRKMAWAKKRAERMERKVHDQLVEGGWITAFADYVNYLCTYGTALIIGPVERVQGIRRCKENRMGTLTYELEYRSIPVFEAVNPWDAYPAPAAKTVSDGPLCIRVRYTSDELWQFANAMVVKGAADKANGWICETVKAVLARYPNGGYRVQTLSNDTARRMLENDGVAATASDCVIEGVRCFATVRGAMIRDIGILKNKDGKTIDPFTYYQVEVISMADVIVYCRIVDARMGCPVSKGMFYAGPDSWWGDAPADKLVSTQRMMNTALKNIIANMAMASGSMLWMSDAGRLVDKSSTALQIKPWKMFLFNNGMGGQTGAPMGTIDIPSRITELWALFKELKSQADEDSGIPAFTYGSNVSGGAGRTASGLAMLTEAANRGMKLVISSTDRDVIREIIMRVVIFNLLYDDDTTLKGDCNVNPSGVMGQILREQESLKRQGLIALVGSDPEISALVGIKGKVALLRPEIQALGINPDDVLPSQERMEEMELLQKIKMLNEASQQVEMSQGGERQPQGGQMKAPDIPQPAQNRGRVLANEIQKNPQQAALNRAGGRGGVAERQGAG